MMGDGAGRLLMADGKHFTFNTECAFIIFIFVCQK